MVAYDVGMAIITDCAVVLRRVDYSETSQVILFFTREHGKVSAIWKGARRGTKTRFAIGIDLLDEGHLTIRHRPEGGTGLATVTEWKPARTLYGLREELFRLHGAQYVCEITIGLTADWDPNVGLFDALSTTLAELSQSDDPLAEVLAYQMSLLRAAGSVPRFDVCVSCARQNELSYFSSFEGGMICRNCEAVRVEKREVSPGTLGVLRGVGGDSSLVGAFGLLNYHIAHLMGREPLLAGKLVPAARRRLVE